MSQPDNLINLETFTQALFEKMKQINPGIDDLELYEFRYCLHPWFPDPANLGSITLASQKDIEQLVNSLTFYESIQMKPCREGAIVLDDQIVRLNRMLFTGLVAGEYDADWLRQIFYFDIRGFYFLPRTLYFTEKVLAHFNGRPFKQFEQKQKEFECEQSIGYRRFRLANAEVDQLFIGTVQRIIEMHGTPLVLAIAGPTAAGKTEIVERLRAAIETGGRRTTSIEMDNFLTDRDHREARGIHSLGKEAIHFELFRQCLEDICHGKEIRIPRYDFIDATSSHSLDGKLKPGAMPIVIEPADIIFIEGNFPFLIPETIHLIGIKVVYLTSDEVRLKRKWKRDIDYRKKYEPTYFRNRYFQSQFPMAQKCYLPQLEVCDLAVDTTGAALWVTPELATLLMK